MLVTDKIAGFILSHQMRGRRATAEAFIRNLGLGDPLAGEDKLDTLTTE